MNWRLLSLVPLLASCTSSPRPAASAAKIDLGPTPAGVFVRSILRTYAVTAATMREINHELARGPATFDGRRWAGVTNAHIRWQYRYRAAAGRCELRSPRVELTVTITMPEWLPERESDEDTKVWWQRYRAALFQHELGHGRIGADVAMQIAREMRRGVTGSSCEELGRHVNARNEAILAQMRQRQSAYDAETRHGGTQIATALAMPRVP